MVPVQTMKKSLKSTVNESGTIQTKLSRFLMSYHSIPIQPLKKHLLNYFYDDQFELD